MTKGKPVEKTMAVTLPPASPPAADQANQPGKIQVTQGNVPIVTVQLLNEINQKLGKMVELLEKGLHG